MDGMRCNCVCTNLSFFLGARVLPHSFLPCMSHFLIFPSSPVSLITHQARKANYQPLSPLSFLERTAKLYPRRTAVAYR